jgi:two-component system phosphate regulon sensor histidine kinase PhoR
MTVTSPIFRKLLAASFLPIFAALLFFDFFLTRDVAQREKGHAEQILFAQATALLGEIDRVKPEEINGWIRPAAARLAVRITVIDPLGKVLADSEGDPQIMENHSGRPEILEAMKNGRGFAVRHSATLDRDLCYAALRLTSGSRFGHVLRLAMPLEDLDRAIAAVRYRIRMAALFAALVAMILAFFISRHYSQRIGRLQAFAGALVDSKLMEIFPPEPADELGGLASSLNIMASRLRAMVEGLQHESEMRASILSSMVEGVLAVDKEMRILFCNRAFAHLVGARLPMPDSLSLLEVSREPGLLQILQDVLSNDLPASRRLRLAVSEGRVLEIQAVPLTSDPHQGVLAILHDVTDRERTDRVRRDFVANVSHELRTPLTSIRGCAETLLDGALEDPESNRHFVEVIQANSIRLSRIASDLLTLSELDAGGTGQDPETISVRKGIDAALRLVESEARLRSVKIFRGNLEDVSVRGDRLRLEQVFVNLLDNAVKFNKPDGRVEIDMTRAEDQTIVIKISDTGIGIPSSDLPRIFERFYRVDKARSREVGGTGLGLSIVRNAVQLMGGSVEAESHLGKGSIFTVRLPSA